MEYDYMEYDYMEYDYMEYIEYLPGTDGIVSHVSCDDDACTSDSALTMDHDHVTRV